MNILLSKLILSHIGFVPQNCPRDIARAAPDWVCLYRQASGPIGFVLQIINVVTLGCDRGRKDVIPAEAGIINHKSHCLST
jgi:hypothetical protein